MQKEVFLYDLEGNMIHRFSKTSECADFFNYSNEYINHNLKYSDKIRKDNKWYRISRKGGEEDGRDRGQIKVSNKQEEET